MYIYGGRADSTYRLHIATKILTAADSTKDGEAALAAFNFIIECKASRRSCAVCEKRYLTKR